MARYCAFLRAINVGGRVVKMQALRELLASCGLESVETFIQSGNAVFESDEAAGDLERAIEARLEEALGYRVATFVRTTRELAEIARRRPFGEREGTVYVAFTRARPGARARAAVEALGGPNDELRVDRREVYWLCRTLSHESPVSGAVIERTLGAEATVRNSTTVRKMAERFCAAP
jgi:uncharacterized protein (DUF1697 family)